MHNFGFSKLGLSELAQDLKKFDQDFHKRTGVDFNFLKTVVASRWSKSGLNDESKDAFRVFDKRERNAITISDMKAVFDEYLDISRQELEEIYNLLDPHGTGTIGFKEF